MTTDKNNCPSLLGPSRVEGSGAAWPSKASGIFTAAGIPMARALQPRLSTPKALHSSPLRPDGCANPTLKELTCEWKETENKQVKYSVLHSDKCWGERKSKEGRKASAGKGLQFSVEWGRTP